MCEEKRVPGVYNRNTSPHPNYLKKGQLTPPPKYKGSPGFAFGEKFKDPTWGALTLTLTLTQTLTLTLALHLGRNTRNLRVVLYLGGLGSQTPAPPPPFSYTSLPARPSNDFPPPRAPERATLNIIIGWFFERLFDLSFAVCSLNPVLCVDVFPGLHFLFDVPHEIKKMISSKKSTHQIKQP